ncbi:MAG: response regulator transcription factor, partial [Candidatus Kapaibacterium sp.]
MAIKILIIDDDAELTELLREFFQSQEAEVEATSSPKEGISLVKSWRPDTVVLDVMLPEMDGFQALKR